MININARRSYDEYHMDVIAKLHDKARGINHGIFYDGGSLTKRLVDQACSSLDDLVIMITSDFITDGLQIDNLTNHLGRLAKVDKKFVIATAVAHCERDFDLPSNVALICLGGDITRLSLEFPQLTPVKNKNLGSSRHWISLSHGSPPHRVAAACVLLSHNLGIDTEHGLSTGLLRISSWPVADHASWDQYVPFFQVSTQHWQELQHGFQLFQMNRHGGQPCGDLTKTTLANNRSDINFDVGLRPLYQDSFLEIINETTFYSKGVFVTEKFLNSVYGFNLPILISNAGTVRYLRDLGFDMFDDIVDHGYDLEQDPFQRVYRAINDNMMLLADRDATLKAWQASLPRFEANLDFARSSMYQRLAQRCLVEFESAKIKFDLHGNTDSGQDNI